MIKKLLLALALAAAVIAGFIFLSPNARRSVELQAVDAIGDIAARRIQSDSENQSGVAAEFINIPIEAREIADGVFQVSGVGNVQLIATGDGAVLFDTGLVTQSAKQIEAMNAVAPDVPLTHIILSHSHADHIGGLRFWDRDGAEIIAHEDFPEEQRYLKELEPYFWSRNRTLFPFMPEEPPQIGLIAYGGAIPDKLVDEDEPYVFELGGRQFEVIAATGGAEGADNVVLWMPKERILFSGDFFGPLFPQFPNIFTMRGEKIRRPVEYIDSLNRIIALEPEMIVPSHLTPVKGAEDIKRDLVKMRDAVKFVHDATVKGMNDGKTVEQLMAEIELPPTLALSEQHGRVSWAVKSIWEYYATWFHFDRTTALYATPASSVYEDIASIAGVSSLIDRAEDYIEDAKPLHALHLLDIAEHKRAPNSRALHARLAALELLLADAKTGKKNSYEIYWLNARIRKSKQKLAEAGAG
ncbi:MAG: MBL fold metallo-hydrolase [Pseudomonadota bacterium]